MSNTEKYMRAMEAGDAAGLAGADYANEYEEQISVHTKPEPQDPIEVVAEGEQ